MLSRAARPLGTSLRLARAYATTPARKPASSAASFADIDDLPRSAKSASRPASTSKASPAAPSETAVAPPSRNEPSAPYNPPRSGAGPGTAVDAIQENWTTSFAGMSERPFDGKAAEVLGQDLDPEDVEMKPDGLIYLPEIKYRRILTKAFGPGGWAMAPRGETNVGPKVVSREWVLVCHGRFVATARGEQEYFDPNGIATASEGAKSNALMRCCKDLGIASELWDPRFIRDFKKKHCVEVFVEDAKTGRKRKLWRRKDSPPFEYPYKESK